MASGLPGTNPTAFGRKALKQIMVRVDREKVDELYRMLREEGISLQEFLSLCIDRYIASDGRMRGIIEVFTRDRQVSKSERDAGNVFSDKERDELLRAIDKGK